MRHGDTPVPGGVNWRLAALYRIVSPALFFHPINERGPKRHKRIVEAKKICSQCPVQQACRDHALTLGTVRTSVDPVLAHESRSRLG
ncbi:WhiB family transcriptional regulator [Rhodococcus sp. 3A]|nr:WhiB family transcriptional regulator [Rhodococcus sp. 3A]